MKSSRLLPWFRSWSRRVPILHGILIAQLIMLPSTTSRGVWVDVDSDGDGIFDTGYDDGTSPPDTTPPPEPEPIIDSDGDNLSDADEAAAGSNPYSPDSDGDGVTDADEVNLTGTDPTSSDSDGDGISDYNEFYGNTAVDEDSSGPGETPYDYDGDGIADPVDPDPLSPQNDPDSDGDYVPDSQDSDPYNPAVWNDANGNGINDDAEIPNNDTDGDGVSNDTDSHPTDPWLNNDWNYNGQNDGDEDADGDGVSNLQDSHPNSNCLWCDWNGNGVNDDVEAGTADSDGDNIADNADSHPFNNGLWEDWNSNGTNDSAESVNSDGDAQPDFSDSDPQNFNLWEDWNRNGINDGQEPPPNPDRDNDLMPNENDSDPDNSALWCDWNRNGINDTEEPPPPDQDNDGHPDSDDSDPGNANLWEDWNHNGYNDNTEGQYLDDDNDSHPNAFDTHPQDALLWSDHNGNGINDENEITITDTDADGYNDDLDTHPSNASLWNDHNDNGINDELELPPDRDGDSIADADDEFPDDFDNDGLTDADELSRGSDPASNDTDGDGLRDGEEVYANTDLLNVDTDSDGLTDFEELRAYQSDPLTPTIITEAPPAPDPEPTNGTSGQSNVTPPGSTSSASAPITPPGTIATLTGTTADIYQRQVAWATAANLTDTDNDGIPDAIEALYAPLVVTAEGNLDGDAFTNLHEYMAGTNINGTEAKDIIPLDFDGDGLTDTVEKLWPLILNHCKFSDAFEDPDGDGLLTIEELNCTHGTKAKIAGLVATNPMQKYSAPSTSAATATYKITTRTPAAPCLKGLYRNGTVPTIDANYWQNRESVYAAWMNDGMLHQSIVETLMFLGPLATTFFNAKLAYRPILTGWTNPANYGYDHLPDGYVKWLAWRGYAQPPLGGRGPTQLTPILTAPFYSKVYPSVMEPGIENQMAPPASGDLDLDVMSNAWEATYNLNFRDFADSDIYARIPEKLAWESEAQYAARVAQANADLARMKDEHGFIRAFPMNFNPTSSLTFNEWTAMNRVDPDHDGLSNVFEYRLNTNPRILTTMIELGGDADNDGFTDREEIGLGTDPLSAASVPPVLITAVSGWGQGAVAGAVLAAPLVAVANQYTHKAGLPVTFSSSAGGRFRESAAQPWSGSVTVISDAKGFVAVQYEAPSAAGSVIVTASVSTGASVAFPVQVYATPTTGATGLAGTTPEAEIILGSANRPRPAIPTVSFRYTERTGGAFGVGTDALKFEDGQLRRPRYAVSTDEYSSFTNYSKTDPPAGPNPPPYTDPVTKTVTTKAFTSSYTTNYFANSGTVTTKRATYPIVTRKQDAELSEVDPTKAWLFSYYRSEHQTSSLSATRVKTSYIKVTTPKGGITETSKGSEEMGTTSSFGSASGDLYNGYVPLEPTIDEFGLSVFYDSSRDPQRWVVLGRPDDIYKIPSSESDEPDITDTPTQYGETTTLYELDDDGERKGIMTVTSNLLTLSEPISEDAVRDAMLSDLEGAAWSAWESTSLRGDQIPVATASCSIPGYDLEANIISWKLVYDLPSSADPALLQPKLVNVRLVKLDNNQQVITETSKVYSIEPGAETSVEVAEALTIDGGGQVRIYATLLPVDLAIDADRNGTIASGETASQNKPFRFWLNNDSDSGEEEEVLGGPSNAVDDGINGIRDLEDFTQIRLSLPKAIIDKAKVGEVRVGFCWDERSSETAVKLYPIPADTGRSHLMEVGKADILLSSYGAPEDRVHITSTIPGDINSVLHSNWTDLVTPDGSLYLLLEGTGRGSGKLKLCLEIECNWVKATGIHMKLLEVEEMIQMGRAIYPGSVTDAPEAIPDPWVNQTPLAMSWMPSNPAGKTFQQDPDESEECVVHVHGWRMSEQESTNWSAMSFKRLWQLGYKGRFAAFRWPTYWSGPLGLSDPDLRGGHTYNPSEYRAWLSGPALAVFVNQLPYPEKRHLFAHSMGNVVCTSALSQPSGLSVTNYAMLNSAMAAMSYDGAIVDFPQYEKTPDTSSDVLAQALGLKDKINPAPVPIINFYLELDSALGIWANNQRYFKPQTFAASSYYYEPLFPMSQKLGFSAINQPTIFRPVTSLPEAMAYVTKSRSVAAGSMTLSMHNISNAPLPTSFGEEHSAAWVYPIQKTHTFWSDLAKRLDIEVAQTE